MRTEVLSYGSLIGALNLTVIVSVFILVGLGSVNVEDLAVLALVAGAAVIGLVVMGFRVDLG